MARDGRRMSVTAEFRAAVRDSSSSSSHVAPLTWRTEPIQIYFDLRQMRTSNGR